jgi:hypothetical protein
MINDLAWLGGNLERAAGAELRQHPVLRADMAKSVTIPT